MKKTLIVASLALLCSLALKAQTALKKVYDEKADPIEQIDKALLKAENEDKFVICQGGWKLVPVVFAFCGFHDQGCRHQQSGERKFCLHTYKLQSAQQGRCRSDQTCGKTDENAGLSRTLRLSCLCGTQSRG